MKPAKIISNQISPNLNIFDGFLGLKYFFHKQKNLDFSREFKTKNYILTNSARTALGKIIEISEPNKNKKIGLPSFICAVVVTPFLAKGYKIEWIDTDKNGLLSFDDFIKKADKISVLILPHILGQELEIEKFAKICRQKKITTIEDCAHLFNTEKLQTDFRIYSFGREKIYSCVSGGALVFSDKFKQKTKFIKLKNANKFWEFRHIFQPIIFGVSKFWWHWGGKIIPWFFAKIKFLPKAVTKNEKNGIEDFPQTKLPYSMQKILKSQFLKSLKIHDYRKTTAKKWQKVLTKKYPKNEIIIPANFFRVILKTNNPQKVKKYFEIKGYDLREWDGLPISPKGVNLKKFGYKKTQSPMAENFAKNYVSFNCFTK